tara:strand:+ start:336 stop:521 length:186 start_codon:yes stop_codon:yes gene_type:complete
MAGFDPNYNYLKLIDGWKDGRFIEVGAEVAKFHPAEIIEFIDLFIKDNGLNELKVLKTFVE